MSYREAIMSKSVALRQLHDSEWRDYAAKLAEKYPYTSTAQEARKAVDKCLGDRRLTDLLYEQRRERPL